MDQQRLLLREATSPWCIGPRKPIRRQLLRKLVLVESIAAPSGGGRSTQLNDAAEKRQMSVELIGLDPQPVGPFQDIMKGQTEPGGWLGQCIGRQVRKLEDQKPSGHVAGRNRLKRFGVEPAPGDKIIGTGGAGAFVTDGIEAALEKAKLAAKGRDVKIGGGVETVRQYLRAGLIDELHFALSPVVLGQGEAIFAGIDLPALRYCVTEHQATDHATHIVLSR